MNTFISEMLKTMGVAADSQKLNCCRTQGTIIDDSKVGFTLTLPDGTTVEVYTPTEDSGAAEEGFAYVPEYDAESPDMCAEDLGDWVDTRINCCKRVDEYFEGLKNGTILNSSLNLDSAQDKFTEDAMSPELNTRCKNVFEAATSGVDVGQNFRYQGARTSENGEYILRTLQVYSPKIGQWYWICKSALQLAESEEGDDWGFIPNYNPTSEGHLVYHRDNRFISMEHGLYGTTISGDDPDKRDRKAAYWLVGILSEMYDNILQNPPVRVYEYFLSAGLAGFSKESVMKMAPAGIIRCIQKGYLDAEKVLKARPEMARQLVEKGVIPPEIVARRSPADLLWLVNKGLVSPDYAVKIDPSIKDKLIKKGLYTVADNIPDDPAAILEGVKSGEIQPIDAYRKNPKLLQPMVEQKLITPQEAYKLDASIVTWLLLNHFIGREEATRVKPDVQKYIARKYKDVNWDDLDASCDGEEKLNAGDNSDTAKFTDKLKKLQEAFAKRQKAAQKAEKSVDDATAKIMQRAAKLQEAAGLNSSLSFNSNVIGDGDNVGEPISSSETPHIFEEGDFSQYGPGYETLAETTAEGPGFIAEVMLPEDNFDGIVVPGESADIAKETLTQMLLANDGTFIDWKPVTDIQAFKAENADKNILVLN